MQTSNPFDLILDKLNQLETTIHDLSVSQQEVRSIPESDPNRLLNLTEAAELVRKPVGTVRHYIHSRDLPATKIGKSYLIKYAELLRWLEGFQTARIPDDPLSPMLDNRKR